MTALQSLTYWLFLIGAIGAIGSTSWLRESMRNGRDRSDIVKGAAAGALSFALLAGAVYSVL